MPPTATPRTATPRAGATGARASGTRTAAPHRPGPRHPEPDRPEPDRLEVVHGSSRRPGTVEDDRHDTPSPREVLRLVLAVASVLVIAVGIALWWLLRPEAPVTTRSVAPGAAQVTAEAPAATTPAPTSTPAATVSAAPAAAFATGVLTGATATAPSTSPDSSDAGGRTTTYAAANLLDGDTGTAWRMEGDGTGTSLTFSFAQVQRITEVGLVNGFAKVDPHDGTDRYGQGRRVLAATWTFDGATTVTQRLVDGERGLQLVGIAPVQTREVVLTVEDTTRPGAGARYDRTALSEVRFANR